ncbi:cAMP-specific 3',5'-cyclic phosphodiesterase 4C [Borealophlyctis nickersoniae]|nr:cAMP-specific 3',5'-cyclic phosphodiesterase 4C [Borealophlyctis nickersoniae]
MTSLAGGPGGGSPSQLTILEPLVHKVSLRFKDPVLESAYMVHFVKAHMKSWRKGLAIAALLWAALFTYHIVTNPVTAAVYRTMAAERASAGHLPVVCPDGYVCSICPRRGDLCSDYSKLHEGLLSGLGGALPIIALYIASLIMTPNAPQICLHAHRVSAVALVILAIFPISVRHFVVEPHTTPYKTAMFYLLLIGGGHAALRLSFISFLVTLPPLFVIFAAEAYATTVDGDFSALTVSCLCVGAAMLLVGISARTRDRESRAHWLRSRSYLQTTAKLADQLRLAHKNYTVPVADFDSPLEKANTLLKGVVTDPALHPEHVRALGTVIMMLDANDLLTPDIDKQVEGGQVELDREQQAWLFSSLYRESGRSRTGSLRKRSIAFEDDPPSSQSIGPTSGRVSMNPSQQTATLVAESNRSRMNSLSATDIISETMEDPQTLITLATSPNLSAASSMRSKNPARSSSISTANPLPHPKLANYSPFLFRTHASQMSSPDSDTDVDPRTTASGTITANNNPDVSNPNLTDATDDVDSETDSLSDFNAQLTIISLLEKVDHWNWDIFDLASASQNRPLFALGHYLFLRNDLYTRFGIPQHTLLAYLNAVEGGYRSDVPYHNSTHAADVLHGVNWLKDRCLGEVVPTDVELLSLYFAALVHDYE